MTSNPYDHRTEEQRLLDAEEPETIDVPVEDGAADLRDRAQQAVASGALDDRLGDDDDHPGRSERR